MIFDQSFKQMVLDACQLHLEDKRKESMHQIGMLKDALANESKSTAGDKHETGRAMIHIELEKAGVQLHRIEEGLQVIGRIKPEGKSTASMGTLVETERGIYFLAMSLGELTVSGVKVFVVSTASPIGALLLGKKKGSMINFQGRTMTLIQLF